MIDAVKELAEGLSYDVVSMGYPGPVNHNRPLTDPANLGKGWAGFDFAGAFGKPVKVVNDALMQAIGSYEGGRMLFLGLGTGLGAAMIADNIAQPMELAHLPYKKGKSFEDYVGERGLEKRGKKKWRKHVFDVVDRLRAALQPDYVVIGGGNVDKLDELPADSRRGDNTRAFEGGFRLWRDKALIV
jgi:polyphosphate glucokinase